MALNATLNNRISQQTITVSSTGGRITSSSRGSGVTLKNQANEIRSIEDIADIVETNAVDGATLVYNSALDKYEVKPFEFTDTELDGGTF